MTYALNTDHLTPKTASDMITSPVAPQTFQLDRANEHDILEIVEIEGLCGLSPWHWEGYYKELTAEPSAYLFVARLPALAGTYPQLSGFITSRLVLDEVHIHNFGVRPAFRRHGVGGALLQAALDYGRQRGATTSFLEVRASNAAAQSLYQQHGFKIVGRRKAYYLQPVEDAVMMLARLQ